MKVIDDGVIKYDRSNFSHIDQLAHDEFREIEFWRKKLYQLNLIGEDEEAKVGFGNISRKYDFQTIHPTLNPQFVISGTQTGKYPELDGTKYTRVIDFDLPTLKLYAMGPLEASSESLTHAAVYKANSNIKTIIHVHSAPIWFGMKKDKMPHTCESISYGTFDMASALLNFAKDKDSGVLYMEGHQDGVISFAPTFEESYDIILKLYNRYLV